ncbi:MAG: hypothetical protein FWF78_10000 [Defluviitaleaceae bacterium]|nr:hypothetical protein [Defluviitaleaceae bacterium]
MNCNCTNGCNNCMSEAVNRQVFTCPATQRVVRHQHIVKHCHDTINEIEVIHEHEYNTRDVVREREVVLHNDYVPHNPSYCPQASCNAPCNDAYAPTPRFGRRW